MARLSFPILRSLALVAPFAVSCGGQASRDATALPVESAGFAGAGGGPIGNSGAGGSAGASPEIFICEAPTPRPSGGGFESCNGSDMRIHRADTAECESGLPRSNVTPLSTYDACTSDTECTDAPNGFCDPNRNGTVRSCRYGCLVDRDCGPGFVCLCGSHIGYCAPAECSTDDDCEPGLLCAAHWKNCRSQIAFACQTRADTCIDDMSCGEGLRCERDSDGVRRCTGSIDPACSAPSAG